MSEKNKYGDLAQKAFSPNGKELDMRMAKEGLKKANEGGVDDEVEFMKAMMACNSELTANFLYKLSSDMEEKMTSRLVETYEQLSTNYEMAVLKIEFARTFLDYLNDHSAEELMYLELETFDAQGLSRTLEQVR